MLDGLTKQDYLWGAGIALALLALYAVSRQSSSSSQNTSSSPAIPASTLASEVNVVNTNAAQVEQTELNDLTQFATYSSGVTGSAFTNELQTAEQQLATVEQGATDRYATQVGGEVSTYGENVNAIENEFGAANGALASDLAQAQESLRTNVQSNAAVTQEQTAAGAQKTSSLFGFLGGLTSAASSFFTGLPFFGGGSSYNVPTASAAYAPNESAIASIPANELTSELESWVAPPSTPPTQLSTSYAGVA